MPEMFIASAGIFGLGILILWWARACRRGTFPHNWIFGYRTPLTIRDKTAWVTVHRALAPFLAIAGGGLVIASSVGGVLAATDATTAVGILLGCSLLWLIAWVIILGVLSARAARAYRQLS